MSKEYFCFESESGETAFLAGVVDALSDDLSLHCVDFHTLDADVFYAPGQDISLLNEAVKKRLRSYYSTLGGLNRPEEIEKLDLSNLVRSKVSPSFDQAGFIPELRNDKAAKDAEASFLRELIWHLGKPVCCFYPPHLPDKNVEIMGVAYMSFSWHYFFIAFEEYIVLMIFGTCE